MLRAMSNAARVSLAVLAGLVLCARGGVAQQARPTPSGGNGTLYIGTHPNQIVIIDEATEQVTGGIPVNVGIPRRVTLSQDAKRFYVISATTEDVEILDIATRKTVDQFRLSEGNKTVRISSIAPDPLGRYVVMITKTTTKLQDRFEIGTAMLQQYDLKEHKISRTIPWPDGQEREQANMLFSPDGKLLYFLGNEVLIFETENFKQVDKWDMSNVEEGLGQAAISFGGFGGADTVNDEPGFFTTSMTITDPIQHRQIMGIAKINLAAKTNEFYTIGPAGGVSFSLAADRKHGFGLESAIGRYQFWTFDLVNHRVTSREEFEGRPRMAMKPSTNSQLLYVFQAGNTIDVYDAASYRYLRTITLAGDETSTLFVVPQRPASRP
jgi:DNA-binding beta-propeller fold protein YncE